MLAQDVRRCSFVKVDLYFEIDSPVHESVYFTKLATRNGKESTFNNCMC